MFRHLSVTEGLPNNRINWITTDAYGMAWIATENGIVRFDGGTPELYKAGDENSYGPAGGEVHYMGAVPGVPGMWVGATTGLSRFDFRSGRWYRVPILYDPTLQTPLPTYVYPFHIDHRDDVWLYVGYYGSICRYDIRRNRLHTITEKSDGRVYTPEPLRTPLRHTASTLQSGVYLADFEGDVPTEKKILAGGTDLPAHVTRAYYARADELWLATDKGLLRVNPLDGSRIVYPFPSALTALAPDPRLPEYLWIGSHNDGIYRFHRTRGVSDLNLRHDAEDPYTLRSNQVSFLHADSLGRLWVGLSGKGVAYADLTQPLFEAGFSGPGVKEAGWNNQVTHLFAVSPGLYLAGTAGSGLWEFSRDGKTRRQIRSARGETVTGGITTGDAVLFQTSEGYFFYNRKTRAVQRLRVPAYMTGMHVFSWVEWENRLYVAGDRGLFRVERRGDALTLEGVPEVNRGLNYIYIQYAAAVGDRLFLKTNFTDFCVFRTQNDTLLKEVQLHHQNYLLNDILVPEGNPRFLLLATSAGIKVWDRPAERWLEKHPYRLNENVRSLAYSPAGLWAATDNGLFRYDPGNKTFERFGLNDGLSSEAFTTARLRLADGLLWGTEKGTAFLVDRFPADTLRKPAWIVKTAHVDGKRLATFYPGRFPDTLVVPAGASEIGLEVSLQGVPPEGRLTYRLRGVDPAEHEGTGNRSEVSYSRLSPGDYLLEWTYREKWPSRNVWQKRVYVRVEKAFYQTGGFRLGMIVLGVLLLWGGLRLIVYRQKIRARRRLRVVVDAQEKERARIAADLHDDLGGKLSTLKLLLEETGRQYPDLKQVPVYTGSLDMLDRSIGDLRTSLYSLNPRTLAEHGVFPALAHLCRRIAESGGPRVEFECAGSLKNKRFETEKETVLYRIAQELLANTLKHAGATEIRLAIEHPENALLLTYTDNGKGFDEAAVEKGLGMQNIRTRLHLAGGKMQLTSAAGQGLKVRIFIPVTFTDTE